MDHRTKPRRTNTPNEAKSKKPSKPSVDGAAQTLTGVPQGTTYANPPTESGSEVPTRGKCLICDLWIPHNHSIFELKQYNELKSLHRRVVEVEDANETLHDIAAKRWQEFSTLRQSMDALMNSNCNMNDTLRSRGFTKGSTEERVIALAQSHDTLRQSHGELEKQWSFYRLNHERFTYIPSSSVWQFKHHTFRDLTEAVKFALATAEALKKGLG